MSSSLKISDQDLLIKWEIQKGKFQCNQFLQKTHVINASTCRSLHSLKYWPLSNLDTIWTHKWRIFTHKMLLFMLKHLPHTLLLKVLVFIWYNKLGKMVLHMHCWHKSTPPWRQIFTQITISLFEKNKFNHFFFYTIKRTEELLQQIKPHVESSLSVNAVFLSHSSPSFDWVRWVFFKSVSHAECFARPL